LGEMTNSQGFDKLLKLYKTCTFSDIKSNTQIKVWAMNTNV